MDLMTKPNTYPTGLEVCANSFASAQLAQLGGAIRIELCENMAEGGTTPSYAQIKYCKTKLNIAVWPIIRPRGGDFLYSDDEFELMKEDIKICRALNCEGAVTGLLLANGQVDKLRCAELIKLAHPMPLAFHRAFDMSNNLTDALQDLIQLGFVRVLSSGGQQTAQAGAAMLAQLVKLANGNIEVMPGAGIGPANILAIKKETGATAFHASARAKVASKMLYHNLQSKMGDLQDTYQYEQTDAALVQQMVNLLHTTT